MASHWLSPAIHLPGNFLFLTDIYFHMESVTQAPDLRSHAASVATDLNSNFYCSTIAYLFRYLRAQFTSYIALNIQAEWGMPTD